MTWRFSSSSHVLCAWFLTTSFCVVRLFHSFSFHGLASLSSSMTFATVVYQKGCLPMVSPITLIQLAFVLSALGRSNYSNLASLRPHLITVLLLLLLFSLFFSFSAGALMGSSLFSQHYSLQPFTLPALFALLLSLPGLLPFPLFSISSISGWI